MNRDSEPFAIDMTSNDIKALVEAEISVSPKNATLCGIDFQASLVKPELIKLINRRITNGLFIDETMDAWLVLEEDPKGKEGQKIIFEGERHLFGLAIPGFEENRYPILVSFYSDFWTALKTL